MIENFGYMIKDFDYITNSDYGKNNIEWWLSGYIYAHADGSGLVDFLLDMKKVFISDEICPCLVEEEL